MIGAVSVAEVALPSTLTTQAGATPNTRNSSTPLPTAPTTAQPTASATPAPTEAPVVIAPSRDNDELVPTNARALWPGTYLVSVGASQRPTRSVSDGRRIWYLDDENRVNSFDMISGELLQPAALPRDATVSAMAVGRDHVYFVDAAQGRIYALGISTAQLKSVPLAFARTTTAIAASPDEHLWMATAASGLVSYDPRTGQVQTIPVSGNLTAITTDAFGRVWTASADRQAVDMWDPLVGKVTEVSLAHGGSITALAVDRSGAVWVGTDTGQTFTLRGTTAGATTVTAGLIGRTITGFTFDRGGALYYVSRTAGAVAYGTVSSAGTPRLGPATASEPMFDDLGRAWQGDFAAVGFYVTVPGARP